MRRGNAVEESADGPSNADDWRMERGADSVGTDGFGGSVTHWESC